MPGGIVIGFYLIFEAMVSVAFSTDQRKISTAGRLSRLLIGILIIAYSIYAK